jgi:hypothetical protein
MSGAPAKRCAPIHSVSYPHFSAPLDYPPSLECGFLAVRASQSSRTFLCNQNVGCGGRENQRANDKANRETVCQQRVCLPAGLGGGLAVGERFVSATASENAAGLACALLDSAPRVVSTRIETIDTMTGENKRAPRSRELGSERLFGRNSG